MSSEWQKVRCWNSHSKGELSVCFESRDIIFAFPEGRIVIKCAGLDEFKNIKYIASNKFTQKNHSKLVHQITRLGIENVIKIYGSISNEIPDLNNTFPIKCKNCGFKSNVFLVINEFDSTSYLELQCKNCRNIVTTYKLLYCDKCDRMQLNREIQTKILKAKRICSVCENCVKI